MRPSAFLATAAAVVVLVATSARAGDDVVVDSWYAHFHKDVKAGWDHVRLTHTTADGKPVWITETETLLLRFMDGSLLKTPMHSSSRIVEDEAGAVISYATSVDGFGPPQKHEGKVADGVVSAVDDGKPRTAPYPTGALGPAAIDRAIVASLGAKAPGDAVEFHASDARGEKTTWTVVATTEPTSVLGRFLWLSRVEKNDETGIPEVSMVDGNGRKFAGATDLGMHQWFLTEESVAKIDATPVSLLTSRIVAPDRAIDAASKPARVVLRLSKKDGKIGNLEDAVGQRVVARKDGAVEIEIAPTEIASGAALPRPYAGKADMKRFLAPTPLVELSNGRLRDFAAQAVGQLINSQRSARMIELNVHDYVQPAPSNVGFGTACDAISSQTGDSTEAAVLAVAWARASGLPARLVAGFVYWDASKWPASTFPRGAFAFHAWAEILVAEGVWHPVDPMRMDGTKPTKNVDELAGHGGFDATHVAVLRSDLATDKPVTDIVLPVLAFMDGLTIEVVEPKATGK